MNISIDEHIKQQMQKTGNTDIVAFVRKNASCCRSYRTVTAYITKVDEDADTSAFEAHPTELGKLYLPREGVNCAENLEVVSHGMLWMRGIEIAGLSVAK